MLLAAIAMCVLTEEMTASEAGLEERIGSEAAGGSNDASSEGEGPDPNEVR